jgi:alpha-tubulin suppressor-like RCC1 family protein
MSGFIQVKANMSFTCGLKSDQTVWCWGENGDGQLGDGTNTDASRPVQVSGLTGVTSIETGAANFACALKTNHTMWCWGSNFAGQLGNGNSTSSNVPVQTNISSVSQISAGYAHTCALKTDGTVWCWGWNIYQMLGDGTHNWSNSPVRATSLTGVTQVRSGWWSNCVVLADATMRCWGISNVGQLGDGSTGVETGTPVTPTGLTGVVKLSDAIGQTVCALAANRTLKCWGMNDHGQLGIGNTTDQNSPVSIPAISDVASVSTTTATTCAVKTDGTPWCWGWGYWGQLGTGSTADQNVPTAVAGVAGASQIAAGYTHSCAVLSDSTVKCWGKNDHGQLGDGTTNSTNSAVSVMAPPSPLSSPASVVANPTPATAKSIDVSWAAVTDASSYAVKIYDATGSSLLGAQTGLSGTSTTISTSTYASMADSTTYKFTVTAIGDGTSNLDSPESSQVSATTNAVAADPNISSQPNGGSHTYGQTITLSVVASVSDGGTLSYQWQKGGVNIGGEISSSYSISSLSLTDSGSYAVVVTNSKSGKLPASTTSATAVVIVSQANQSAVTLTSTTATFGSPMTLVATGGSGSGSYSFAVSSAGTAGCSITSGSLVSTSPGTCTVTATRGSSTNYLAASSAATTVTVSRPSQAPLLLSTFTGDLYTGIIIAYTGGSGTGSVSSSVTSGTAGCVVTGNVVSATHVGTCVLTLTKAADSNFAQEVDSFTLTFAKAVPTVGSVTSPSTGVAGSGITLNFAGGSGTGSVTYSLQSPGSAGCSISNGKLLAASAGTCSVTITKLGDDTYQDQVTTSEFTFKSAPVAVKSANSTTTTTPVVTSTLPAKGQIGEGDVAPSLVHTKSAEAASTINGETTHATTSRVNNQLVFTTGGFTVTLAGVNADGSVVPLTSDGTLRVRRGDMFRLDAQGFAPGSKVNIWMFSQSFRLATLTVGSDGLVRSTLRVPKSVENGLHHLVLVGTDKSAGAAKFEMGMDVGVAPKQWWYSRLLIIIPITLAVFAGLWLPTTARRRRRRMV